MGNSALATEATKTALENSVTWYLTDKMQDASVLIATKKFLTNENVLIYLTKCTVGSATVPTVKVQIFQRVKGGIHEVGYQLFSDHRLAKYENDMLFGTRQNGQDGSKLVDVTEEDAAQMLALVNSLATARQTL